MTDELILRLVDETSKVLARMEFFNPCGYLIPSYNALVRAAQANHPDDAYLGTAFPILSPSENGGHPEKHKRNDDGVNPPQLRILFTQLRIILESLQSEDGTIPPAFQANRPAEHVDVGREMYRAEGREPKPSPEES